MTSASDEEWLEAVEQAAEAGDAPTLRRLYAEALQRFGDQAPHRWATALSALDGTAQTG